MALALALRVRIREAVLAGGGEAIRESALWWVAAPWLGGPVLGRSLRVVAGVDGVLGGHVEVCVCVLCMWEFRRIV